jgi:hypothetical protein
MDSQITRLRINSTNIKNSLVGYNKELRKIRLEESRISFNTQKQKQAQEKEKKLESGIGKTVESVKSKVLAGPLGFFDKLKEFFGLVFLGLLINNLPQMIAKLKEFFGKNAWLVSVTKITLKLIGDGIMGMIRLVDEYPSSVMAAMDNERKYVANEIDRVIAIAEGAYSIWNNFLNGGSSSSGPLPKGAPVMAPTMPGSMYPSTTPSVPSAGQSSPPGPTAPAPDGTQRYAKGGTVKSKGQNSKKSMISSGFRGASPTPQGQQAIESIDSFENFETVSLATKINAELLSGKDGVNDTFAQVNKAFADFLNVIRGEKRDGKSPSLDQMDPGTTRPGQQDPFKPSTAVEVSGDYVGRIGSTGRSSGPHLHIEWGNGWGDRGNRPLSKSILNGVFIGGVPLSKMTRGDGLGAGRGHRGFDFPANSGTPITLGPGLKFVEYSPGDNAGYGNVTIIVDENGQQYLLGHLSGGPSPSVLKKLKGSQKKKDVVSEGMQQLIRTLERNPETSSIGSETTYLITQTFEKPVVVPTPYPVTKVVTRSKSDSFYGNSSFDVLS